MVGAPLHEEDGAAGRGEIGPALLDRIAPFLDGLGYAACTSPHGIGTDGLQFFALDGTPALAVLVDEIGDSADVPPALVRAAWSAGCPHGLVVRPDETRLVAPAGPDVRSSRGAAHRFSWAGLDGLARPLARKAVMSALLRIPSVVPALASLMDGWRAQLLRRALADRQDWTEEAVNLAIETPIVDLLLGGSSDGGFCRRAHRALEDAGIDLEYLQPDLLAQAWMLHLREEVRVRGGDIGVTRRRTQGEAAPLPGPVLRACATEALRATPDRASVLHLSCGAGRLLRLFREAAGPDRRDLCLYGVEDDPRAVLFARRFLASLRNEDSRVAIAVGHPLLEPDLLARPLLGLVPPDARGRLRPIEIETAFPGVPGFDLVLVADSVPPLSRRPEIRQYLVERYEIDTVELDPLPPLIERGADLLAAGARIVGLLPAALLRSGGAGRLRAWLGERLTRATLVREREGIVALIAEASLCPSSGSVMIGTVDLMASHRSDRSGDVPFRRSLLDAGGWSFSDPARTALLRAVSAAGAPLGEVLVGGVLPSPSYHLNPDSVIGAGLARRLLRLDRRLRPFLRPVIEPSDVAPFSSVKVARQYRVDPLPPLLLRRPAIRRLLPRALPRDGEDLTPSPVGQLFFVEGAPRLAFLFDRAGYAVPAPGVGTVRPADPFLLGLLGSALVASLWAERCPDGTTARCLARLPVRFPDLFDDRERAIRDRIVRLVEQRLAEAGRGSGLPARRTDRLQEALDLAVLAFYGLGTEAISHLGRPPSDP